MKQVWHRGLLLAALTLALAAGQPGPPQGPFADVPPHHWADEAVDLLAARGLSSGYPGGTFRGDRAIIRYEVAVAVHRMLQDTQRRDPPPTVWPLGPTAPGPPLKDVPAEHWAADSVDLLRTRWGIGTGIITGYPDATFAGDRPMSREEFSIVLQRLHTLLVKWIELGAGGLQ